MILGLILSLSATKSFGDWSGFYSGIYLSKDATTGVGSHVTTAGYTLEADADKNNAGFFLGYNHAFGDVVIGIETSMQETVGLDQGSSGVNGTILWEDLMEFKIKLGYNLNNLLVYTHYGVGDLDVYWDQYENDPASGDNYETIEVGIETKITNGIFVGLSIFETTLDLTYGVSNYIDEMQHKGYRLRIGYLF